MFTFINEPEDISEKISYNENDVAISVNVQKRFRHPFEACSVPGGLNRDSKLNFHIYMILQVLFYTNGQTYLIQKCIIFFG